MALIEVDTGVFYDEQWEPDYWYKQSPECQNLGLDTIENHIPESISEEVCLGGEKRLLRGVWVRTTDTGTFRMEVQRHYKYPPDSPAFRQRERHDTVILTIV